MERARSAGHKKRRKEMEHQRTERFSVEVRSGSARFRVGVQAQSIREALRLVGSRHPRGVVKGAFPTQQETIFVHQRTHEAAA
jgi:hypothetical protein